MLTIASTRMSQARRFNSFTINCCILTSHLTLGPQDISPRGLAKRQSGMPKRENPGQWITGGLSGLGTPQTAWHRAFPAPCVLLGCTCLGGPEVSELDNARLICKAPKVHARGQDDHCSSKVLVFPELRSWPSCQHSSEEMAESLGVGSTRNCSLGTFPGCRKRRRS